LYGRIEEAMPRLKTGEFKELVNHPHNLKWRNTVVLSLKPWCEAHNLPWDEKKLRNMAAA
jgi:hypothetical protein